LLPARKTKLNARRSLAVASSDPSPLGPSSVQSNSATHPNPPLLHKHKSENHIWLYPLSYEIMGIPRKWGLFFQSKLQISRQGAGKKKKFAELFLKG
jgi:hypothetical protein